MHRRTVEAGLENKRSALKTLAMRGHGFKTLMIFSPLNRHISD
jgi:hypothetical protein